MPSTVLPTPARRLLATALTLLISVSAAVHAAAPAHAGENHQSGSCITSYNYADAGLGYLYASTGSTDTTGWPDECRTVEVSIRNGGCSGTTLAYDSGLEYVSASAWLASSNWSMPCSAHYGGYWIEAHWLPFNY